MSKKFVHMLSWGLDFPLAYLMAMSGIVMSEVPLIIAAALNPIACHLLDALASVSQART